MPTVPPFTPIPNGFITVQPLPDGRLVVESWWLDTRPSDTPETQPVHHWIAADPDEARKLIADFTGDHAALTRNP
ncbi:hypothetical protein [Streptomyces sp. NPDC059786]|uniref:hypothetical protein n=1 Tax=Streptomyces sp. NPDC059786 TaxID=3346946 RepID=UPI00364E109D